ncbi:MAG: c-type cytochrome [Beijerinckiaceae bacterium]
MNSKKIATIAISLFAVAAYVRPGMAADADAGQAIFNQKCKICHQIGPSAKNFVGPELNGLAGRKTGAVEGYNYSDANKNSGITWSEEEFKKYITNPKVVIPGTKMVFAGLPKDSDRDNLWAFISQFKADGSK